MGIYLQPQAASRLGLIPPQDEEEDDIVERLNKKYAKGGEAEMEERARGGGKSIFDAIPAFGRSMWEFTDKVTTGLAAHTLAFLAEDTSEMAGKKPDDVIMEMSQGLISMGAPVLAQAIGNAHRAHGKDIRKIGIQEAVKDLIAWVGKDSPDLMDKSFLGTAYAEPDKYEAGMKAIQENKQKVMSALRTTGQGIQERGIGNTLGELPAGLLSVVSVPVSAFLGTQVLEEGNPVLTVEDQARAWKETIGFIAAGAVGRLTSTAGIFPKGAGNLIGELPVRSELIRSAGKSATASTFEKALVGTGDAITSAPKFYGTKLAEGLSQGLVSGATFGAIAGANEEDQVDQIITNMIMFGTLGSLFHLSGAKRSYKNEKAVADWASHVSAYRDIAFDMKNSITDVVRKVEVIKGSEEFFEGLQKGQLLNHTDDLILSIDSQFNRERLEESLRGLNFHGIESHDGTSMYVSRNPIDKDVRAHFAGTGFLPDEIVYYDGKPHKVIGRRRGGDQDVLQLALPTEIKGKYSDIEALPSEVRRASRLDLAKDNPLVAKVVAPEGIIDQEYTGVTTDVDAINSQYWGHGERTRGSVAEEPAIKHPGDIDISKSSDQNMVGPGLYMSQALKTIIWDGYASVSKLAYVFKLKLKKVLNADLPLIELPDEVQKYVHDFVAKADYDRSPEPNPRGLLDNIRSRNPNLLFSDIYSSMMGGTKFTVERSTARNWIDEGQYEFNPGLMQQLGYDALTHEGGRSFGSKKHQVIVLLNASTRRLKPEVKETIDKLYAETGEVMKNNTRYGTFSADYITDPVVREKYLKNHLEARSLEEDMSNWEHGVVENVESMVLKKPELVVVKPLKIETLDIASVETSLYDSFREKLEAEVPFSKAFSETVKPIINPAYDINGLKYRFTRKLMDEADLELSARDMEVMSKITRKTEAKMFDKVPTFDEFTWFTATSNNIDPIVTASGKIRLVDKETGDVIGEFDNIDLATKFINTSRQADGPNLNGDNIIPPDGVGPTVPPGPDRSNSGPNRVEWKHFKPNWRELLFATGNLNISARGVFFAPSAELFQAADILTLDKTGNASKFYDMLHERPATARKIENARRAPFIAELQKIVDEMMSLKLSTERRQLLQTIRTIRNPAEVINTYLGRKMNEQEVQTAQALHAIGFHSGKEAPLLSYLYESVKKDADKDQLRIKNGLDSQQGKSAISMLEKLRDDKETKHSIGAVLRLIQSYGDDVTNIASHESGRAEFIAKNKITEKELKIVDKFDDYFKSIATEFDLERGDRVLDLMAQSRLYTNGNINLLIDLLNEVGGKSEKEFYKSLANETGEIKDYELDPAGSALRLTNGAFAYKYFRPSYIEALKYLKESKKTMPEASVWLATTMFKDYITAMRGWNTMEENVAQHFTRELFNRTGLDKHISPPEHRDFVRGITSLVEAGVQGGRIKAGLIDTFFGAASYGSWFGFEELGVMIKNGLKATAEGNKLVKEGVVSGIDVYSVSDPVRAASGGVLTEAHLKSRVGQKSADAIKRVLFRMSGQKDIYNIYQQGAYITGMERAANALKKMSDGIIDVKEMQKEAKLDAYSIPVKTKFMELVEANSHLEAAKFLGRETPRRMLPSYGNGNGPIGWNNTWGRLFGQFGTFSTFARTQLQDMLSVGSVSSQLARVARFSAMNAILAGISYELDIDLNNWYLGNSWVTSPGPIGMSLYQTARYFGGSGYDKKEAAAYFQQNSILNRTSPDVLRKTPVGLLTAPQYWPGGLLMKDVFEANEMRNRGQPASSVALRGLGFRKLQGNPDFIDIFMSDAIPGPDFTEYFRDKLRY